MDQDTDAPAATGTAPAGRRWWRRVRSRLPPDAEKKLNVVSTLLAVLGTLTAAVVGVASWVTEQVTSPTPPERTPSCHVRTADSQLAGYLWANRPTVSRYAPAPQWQCNSKGARNTVQRERAGSYTARFPSLGIDGGTVEVTAAGDGDRMCGVVDWRPSDDRRDEIVRIWCADPDGVLADSAFFVRFLFLRGVSSATAYLRADQPQARSYTVTDAYRYNSKGGTISVDKHGKGLYLVFLQGQQEPLRYGKGGTVKVTALGINPAVCNVRNWFGYHDTYLGVFVQCYTVTGVPVDAAFTMTYSVDLGGSRALPVHGAYLWADRPTAASYSPHVDYQFNSRPDAMNSVTRLDTGRYAVQFTGPEQAGGNVQVSAYGSAAVCAPLAPTHRQLATRIEVHCRSGRRPVDAMFTLTFWQ